LRKRRRWLLVATIVLALGLGYAVYSLFIHSAADYLTVSELKSQVESLDSQQVRVGGRIVPGSIDWDDRTEEIRFAITDDKESLTIVYEGLVPDSFEPGAEVIVEGRSRTDDIFEALSFGSPRSLCNLCH
jgi:cytochrome c-type biogenesis protein CcmE